MSNLSDYTITPPSAQELQPGEAAPASQPAINIGAPFTIGPYIPPAAPASLPPINIGTVDRPPTPQTPGPTTGPYTNPSSGSSTNVKVSTRHILDLTDVDLTPDATADLLFEEIGGQELADMLSFATVSGINPKYRVITNIGDLKYSYDPTRLVSEHNKVPQRFEIDLNDKIPDQTFLSVVRDSDSNVKINLVVILDNIEEDEELEIQVVKSGSALTIG